jgi:hypothetical protein
MFNNMDAYPLSIKAMIAECVSVGVYPHEHLT